ncbi:unnamed protein product [Closterium sp. Yama58-4]|nr:unnamed protein product [Closterium sp. Yama58-4]
MEVLAAPHADPPSPSLAFANRACDAPVLTSTAGKALASTGGSGGGGEGSGGVKPAEKRHRARVYTRTGDKGTSSLYTGERRRKDDCVFGALRDVVELNRALAVAAEYCRVQGLKELCDQIAVIQSRLLDVGPAVATPPPSASAAKLQRVRFDPTAVDTRELWIDALDEKLPPLTAFILPSGGMAAARSVCRRAERAVIAVAAGAAAAAAAAAAAGGSTRGIGGQYTRLRGASPAHRPHSHSKSSSKSYSIVLFAGVAAEAVQYGQAEGGEGDENLFKAFLSNLQPSWSGPQMANQARWAVVQAYLLLQRNRAAHSAVVEVLKAGGGMGDVVMAIEHNMAG